MIRQNKHKGKVTAILCSDFHLRDTKPTCWETTEEFLYEQWASVQFVSKLQEEHECDVLHAGDLFHKWKPTPALLSETIKFLPKQFYTVYGNHDLPQHSMELRKKCGLYTLETDGTVKTTHRNYELYNWGEEASKEAEVLVWHKFTYKEQTDIPTEEVSALKLLRKFPNTQMILTGDNHEAFTVEVEGRILVNPGSLTRQTTKQKDFRPRVYLWYEESNTVEPVYIPIKPDAIHTEHIEVKEQRNERITAFVEGLNTDFAMKTDVESNLEAFRVKNKVEPEVMNLILKAIDNDN